MADFKGRKRGKSHVQNMGICFGGSGYGPESPCQISAYYKFFRVCTYFVVFLPDYYRLHSTEISFLTNSRGGVEDTRLEAKAKDTKNIRGQGQGQGQPFRGQTLSRPRTGMLEAKAKDIAASVLQKKRSSKKFFRQSPIYRRSQNF